MPIDQRFDLDMSNQQFDSFGSRKILHAEGKGAIDEIALTTDR
jgi:hypothetical protein